MPSENKPAGGDTLIEIDHVTFGYDASRTILNDISLRFQRGKVTSILGSSGCGKTKLLRLIGGVHAANSGTVTFDGEVVDSRNRDQLYRLRRRMGVLFQFGALFTDLSVFDNVAFPLREQTDLTEAMIRDIVLMKLNAVGLRCARDLMPSELSGGMARRVATARAVALDPELVMYDEPFSGLDPISLNTAARLVRNLNDAMGLTSILVSHELGQTLEVADEVIVLDQGRVAFQGPVDQARTSSDPLVYQYMHQRPDGPVRFHYPAVDLKEDFGVA